MQAISDTQYRSIIANPSHKINTEISIDDFDIYYSSIISARTYQNLFGDNASKPLIGNCSSGQIDLTFRDDSRNIFSNAEKAAEINLIFTAQASQTSTEYSKKPYYIYTRDKDDMGVVSIHGYDIMLKASKLLYTQDGSQGYWPKTPGEVVDEIAERLGIDISSHFSTILSTITDKVCTYPGYGEDGLKINEVLGYVAGMFCGNAYINENNKLDILRLNEHSSYVFDADTSETTKIGKELSPYTKVSIVTQDADGNELYISYPESGGDNGLELIFNCQWAQDTTAWHNICYKMYQQVHNYVYIPITASNVVSDPALELGDQISADNKTSIILSYDFDWDYLFIADLAAPIHEEESYEYDFSDPNLQNLERKLNKIQTELYVIPGQILAKVAGPYAPEFSESITYNKGAKVLYNGNYYVCINDDGTGPGEFDPDDWQVTSIGDIADARMEVKIGQVGLYLDTSQGSAHIVLKPDGTGTPYISLEGALAWGDLDTDLQAYIETFLNTHDVKGLLNADFGITQTQANKAYIASPTIIGGSIYAAGGGSFTEMVPTGFNVYTSLGSGRPIIGLGYNSSDYQYPFITLGHGVDTQGTDAGMIKKYSRGLFIGDNDDQTGGGQYPSSGNGIFIDFGSSSQVAEIYKVINGNRTTIGGGAGYFG